MNVPRDLAVRVLTRVLSDRQTLDDALAALTTEGASPIQGAERAWLQEVCSGTLRWKGRLDLAIDAGALKKKPTGWLRKILLVASYQLIVQDRVQPARVVSETVSEIKRKEGEAPARFANAVLRKIAEHAPNWRDLKLHPSVTIQEAARWASLPEWFWVRMEKDHGREWLEKYALASLARPSIWIRNRNSEWRADWAEAGPVPGSFRIVEGGPIFEKAGFDSGEFFVQDISSQTLIAEISEKVRQEIQNQSTGERITALDLCAAPGGKSVGLSWNRMHVISSDRDSARLALLRQTVERVGQGIEIRTPDQIDNLPLQDVVWVDAPCTGSGILRRHPDVRWLRTETEFQNLLHVQKELIARGWSKVRPGGFFVYSVCSVLKDEGPRALERAGLSEALKAGNEWFLVPQEVPFGDGFWACLIRKAEK